MANLHYQSQPPVSSSMEDYLEAILEIEKEKKVVRVRDVAKKLGVTLPSVSGAIKTLERDDLVRHEKYEYIELSDKGRHIASEIARRHVVLRDFLTDILGLDAEKAEHDACHMEHNLTPETLEGIIALMEFLQSCPAASIQWRRHRDKCRIASSKEGGEGCIKCLRESIDLLGERMQILDESILQETTMDKLDAGESGIVTGIRGSGPLRRRLTEMGIIRGALLKVERGAPLSDPIEIHLRGYHLSLRKVEANLIRIRRTGLEKRELQGRGIRGRRKKHGKGRGR